MQLRRILLALAISATVGLTAACGHDSGGTTAGATPAGSGAAGAASGAASNAADGTPGAGGTAVAGSGAGADSKANTQAVCKGVVAAYDKEKVELMNVLAEMMSASAGDDKAALTAAKAKGEVILGRLTKAVNAELAKATDPAAKAALQQFVATFATVLSADKLDDPAFEAELDKAGTAAAKYCPELTT